MSDQPLIRVENLSKRYVLGHQVKHDTLLDTLGQGLSGLWTAWRRRRAAEREEFWALRDVSFEARRGEVVGIIGRNGAGKSTLLKILARITEPTTGRVELRGRVASLLEVGTGFHPELTGRDNIFLNGAILGMSRKEIRLKFDEIVAFAEVERFLDTPVKRYSSGMYVRLAFAVAAHLEPEILVVDEVLAVGDTAFQKKCLGKMQSVAADSGRTVLFVSHNMPAVQHLCSRGILLQGGQVLKTGAIQSVVAAYLNDSASSPGQTPWRYRHTNPSLKVTRVELRREGQVSEGIIAGQPCSIAVHYECHDPRRFEKGIGISLTLKLDESKITNLWSQAATDAVIAPTRSGCIECHLTRWPFREGKFSLDVYTHFENEPLEWIEGCLNFVSHDGDFYNSGRIANAGEGLIFLPQKWENKCR